MPRETEASEHLPEHEEHEKRLQDDLREERWQVAPRDVQVAVEDGAEGPPFRRLLDRR